VGGRWRFLVVVVVSVFAFAGTAQASPLFLSAINISDPGQDGFEPQVAIDSNQNVHALWTRSDGTFFRIQYSSRTPGGSWSTPVTISAAGQSASEPQLDIDSNNNILAVWTRFDGSNNRIQGAFKPAAGSFAAAVDVSDPGFAANAPQVDFDNANRALVVWQRFDGAKIRVQGTIREAGAGGTFQNETTLSDPDQDALSPQSAAGANVDANGVVVWYRSDGTNLRVQSARRRDYVGYVRPLSAASMRAPLVPAYNQCSGTGNRVHGPPLVFPSCNPPAKSSSVLTVGTNDANGVSPTSKSSVKWRVVVGNAATEANEADVQVIMAINDVRNEGTLTDYTGRLGVRMDLQMTDQRNAPEMPEAGTSKTQPLEVSVQCTTTASTTTGGACIQTTSLNAVLPGAVIERRRASWALGTTIVRDAGANGTGYAACPPTCGDGDEKDFMRQGIFIP
jgi:hypothetical protein